MDLITTYGVCLEGPIHLFTCFLLWSLVPFIEKHFEGYFDFIFLNW